MTITSYDTLVQAIKDLAEDDGAEFATYIPTAIDTAEEILYKELDLPDLEVKAPGNLVTGNNTLAKPTGYKKANYIKIKVSGKDRILKKRREDYIIDYWPDSSVLDIPKYYADTSATAFLLAPTPNSTYAYEIKYPQVPTKLASTNQSNYFITSCHPILLNACMMEMARFMKAWSQVDFWTKEYARLRDTWNLEAKQKDRDDGQSPMSPTGPNTIRHTMKTEA